MSITTLSQRLAAHPLLQRRQSLLLATIVGAIAVRPLIGDSPTGGVIFSLALLTVLLLALLTIQVDDLVGERETLLAQRRRRIAIGWAMAVPAVAERVYMMIAPTPRLFLIGSLSWFAIFAFVTWSQLRSLLKHRDVTGETISLSISIYLLFGLTCGVLYMVIFQFDPNAYNFGGPAGTSPFSEGNEQHIFPLLIYFSLTTLSTIGFGDITPLTLQARYSAVAEGIAGQFYMAILVARLVGLHMSRTTTES